MKDPNISVVVPLYNKARYIRRAVQSVLAQTIHDFELLIVDDGSTDEGLSLIADLADDERIVVISQSNAGEGAARNRGLAEMRGDIAAFLDADDEWLPTHLGDLAEIASTYPQAGLLATGFRAVYRGGLAVDHSIDRRFPSLITDYYRLATSGHTIHVSACAASRSLLAQGVSFREGAPCGADQEFYARAVLHTSLAYHPRISSLYHRNVGGSVLANTGWLEALPLTAESLSQMLRVGVVPASLRESAAAYLTWIIEQHALAGVAVGKKVEALSLLRQAHLHPIPDRCKRRLEWLGLVVQGTPLSLLTLAVRFRKSRWRLAVAGLLSKQTVPESPSAPVRATTWRHGSSYLVSR